MSTNDTVVLLASGASGVSAGRDHLADAVTEVCASLARQLVADAEGAHHDIAVEVRRRGLRRRRPRGGPRGRPQQPVQVRGLRQRPELGPGARRGRHDRGRLRPAALDVSMNGVQVCRAGGVGEDRALVDLVGREVHVVVDLHAGDATATIWTNDLTHDYVHENSAYST